MEPDPPSDPFLEAYGPKAWALYVHVPFCDQKCAYCDFFTITDSRRAHPLYSRWLDLCSRELELWLEVHPSFSNRPLGTLSFGGGTPSLLDPSTLMQFISRVAGLVPVAPDWEVALEIQPGTVHASDFPILSQAGINRLSIGVQTLNPAVLAFTGRRHTASESIQAITEALATGASVGADFIGNLPGEPLEDFLAGLSIAADIGVSHLSAYDLTWHEGTAWERAARQGELTPANEAERTRWQTETLDYLETRGFGRYEVSNFCRPGRESRHNCAYWEGADYIGLGAGAHSFVRPGRYFNPPQADAWARALTEGRLYARATDSGDRAVMLVENLHMGLRKTSGVSRGVFLSRFGHDPLDLAPGVWRDFAAERLAQWDDQRVWLTRSGLMRLDGLTEYLVTRVSLP